MTSAVINDVSKRATITRGAAPDSGSGSARSNGSSQRGSEERQLIQLIPRLMQFCGRALFASLRRDPSSFAILPHLLSTVVRRRGGQKTCRAVPIGTHMVEVWHGVGRDMVA